MAFYNVVALQAAWLSSRSERTNEKFLVCEKSDGGG